MGESPVPDSSTPRGRVVTVLDRKFGGNQSAMSRATGVPQATISRIVRGVQEPGRGTLTAIAALPGIDPVWVHTGRGEPFLTEERPPTTPDSGWTLPVAEEILADTPGRCRPLLSGERRPVMRDEFGLDRYWLRFSASIPIPDLPEGQNPDLKPADLLLMDADLESWKQFPEKLDGRLVACQPLWLPTRTTILARWGRNFHWRDSKTSEVFTCRFIMPTTEASNPFQRQPKGLRPFPESEESSESRVVNIARSSYISEIYIESILSVCILMVRSLV